MARTETSLEARSLLPLALHLWWRVRRELAEDLDPFRLTVAQYVPLVYLATARREVGMAELAQASLQDPATMTAIVDLLVRRGWVARRRSSSDRRRVAVRLTLRGRALLRAVPRRLDLRWRRALRGMNRSDQLALLRLLQQLLDGLKETEASRG
ncbi:MAG TPA: MarR family transcriptional regulator [Anaerolineales bacterium]|nr:MarR family transcriptional regulator [Anaerolineales bacterium]